MPTPRSRTSAFEKTEDGTLQVKWDPYLPRPPSMREMNEEDRSAAEQVAVFGANTPQGALLVKMCSRQGLRVVAAARVFTPKKVKELTILAGVTVREADSNNAAALLAVTKECARAFIVTQFWEKFNSKIEEGMAMNILDACEKGGIKAMVVATFENCEDLQKTGNRSQISPSVLGSIYPSFHGKSRLDNEGKKRGILITHMMTSYFDKSDDKRSLILIRSGKNNRIVVNDHHEKQ